MILKSMAKFEIRFKKSVARDLRAIPNTEVSRILRRIDRLAENPRHEGCVKLSGMDYYRVRVGLCRIIYEIQDANLVVLVIKAGHRSDIYRHS